MSRDAASARSAHLLRELALDAAGRPPADAAGPIGPNAAQMASPSYRLAALDTDFLLSAPMRGVRFLLEFEKADLALRAYGVSSTIVVFGSARVREDGSPAHRRWYADARRFAEIASREGGALLNDDGRRHHVIATGGGPGLMEAANRGAFDAGAVSIGFNVSLPREQEPNPFSTPDLTFRFHYFAMRKMHLAIRANALVAFPGGFGTFDELFEVLTLRQTGRAPSIPIALYDEAYWRSVVNFDALREAGMISEEDLALFRFADTPEALWAALLDQGLTPGREPVGPDVASDLHR